MFHRYLNTFALVVAVLVSVHFAQQTAAAATQDPIFRVPQMPIGLVPAYEIGCLYVIYEAQIGYSCRGSIDAVDIILPTTELLNRRIVSWAQRAHSNNTLFFATKSIVSASDLATLASVTKIASSSFSVPSIMLISIDNVLTNANRRTDMIMTSWDKLYVLGAELSGSMSTYGFYEVEPAGFSKIVGLDYVPSAPTVLRNPFFVEYESTKLAFRIPRNSSQDDVVLWNSLTPGVIPSVVPRPSQPGSLVYGPIRADTNSIAFVSCATESDTVAIFSRHLFTSGSGLNSLTTTVGSCPPITQFRGIVFSDRTTAIFFEFSSAHFTDSGSLNDAVLAAEVYHDGYFNNTAFVVSGGIVYNASDMRQIVPNEAGQRSPLAAAYKSKLYSVQDENNLLAVYSTNGSAASVVVEASSCVAAFSAPLGLILSPVRGYVNEHAIAAFTSTGVEILWMESSTNSLISATRIDPGIPVQSNRMTGFDAPFTVALQKRIHNNLLLLSTQTQTSSSAVPVLATRASAGNPWAMKALLAYEICIAVDKPQPMIYKFSPDGNYAVIATAKGLNFQIYFASATNWTNLQKLYPSTSSIPLVWRGSDVDQAKGLPVAFHNSSFTIMARVDLTADSWNIYQFLYGNLSDNFETVTGFLSPTWAVTESMPQTIHYRRDVNSSQIYTLGTQLIGVNCDGACNLSPLGNNDSLAWEPHPSVGNATVFRMFNSSGLIFNGTFNGTVSLVYPVRGSPRSFIFSSPVSGGVTLALFRDGMEIGRGDLSIGTDGRFGSPTLCGSWSDGIALLYNNHIYGFVFSTGTLHLFNFQEAVGCKQLSDLSYSMFLITKRKSIEVIDVGAVPPVQNIVYSDSRISLTATADIIFDPRYPGAASIVVTVHPDSLNPPLHSASSVVALSELVCTFHTQCPIEMACTNRVCRTGLRVDPPAVSPAPGCSGQSPPFPQAICVNGQWIVQGSVVVSDGMTVVIGGTTLINGSLVINQGVTITLRGNSSLQVTDCATFAGSLEVERSAPESTVLDGRLVVISFGGFCNGTQSTFQATSLRFTNQPACAKVSASRPEYSATSVTLLFSYDLPDCSASALSTGAIAGIAVGVVAFVAVVVAIILVLKFKNIIRPFSSTKTDNHVELD